MILLLDNYDSFTYNLAQYLGELGCEVEVHRNDKISVEEIARRKPERIVISPGPCTPQEAGISVELIQRLAGKFPILGVCLGHQAMGAAFGGKIVRAPKLFHGKTSEIHHDGKGVFRRLAEAVYRHALPLADRGEEIAAEGIDDHGRDGRRHHHGCAAQAAQTRRRAVPSGIGADGIAANNCLQNFLEL